MLNERIRNINYKIERYHHDKCMYKKQVEEILQHDQEMWNACNEEIQKRRELRHQRVMDRQMSIFNRLLYGQKKQEQGGHSNKDGHKDQGQHIDKAKK